jgi:hypothetical protein
LATVIVVVGNSAGMALAAPVIPLQAFIKETAFERIGCGMRKLLWQEVYILCLYTGPGSASMLRMDIVYEGDMPDGMPDDWQPHLKKVISEETIDLIDASFGRLDTGDIVQFAYLPETQESAMLVNDQAQVSVPGMELYSSIQARWLGDKPISNKLKKTIVNRDCEIC